MSHSISSPFAALRNGLGGSISEVDDRARGATNCLEHPEQDWATTLWRGTGARWLLRRRRRRLSTYGGGRSPPWGHELALLLGLSLAVLLPFGRFIVDRRSTFTGDLSLTHCSHSSHGSRLVGMKRQRDLHGNVVASFCPTTEERAHRFATGRTPGGQLPYGYDRARSAQARESAVRADGGRGDRGAPDRHEPRAVYGGAREPSAGPHPRGGVDRERVGRPTLGELGARGDRGGPELRADVRHAPPRGEDRSAGCAHLGRGVPPRRLPTGAPRLGPPAPRAGAARGARRADPDAHPLRQRGEGAGAPRWTAAAARQSGAHGREAGRAAGAAGPGTRAAARPLRAPQ